MKELPDDCMMIFHGLTQYASEVFHEAQTLWHTIHIQMVKYSHELFLYENLVGPSYQKF